MPDYQWAVGKGKIITADYDRSMSLNADQVENEIRNAFSNKEIDKSMIIEYAKRLKCEKKIRMIMEVFI